MTEIKTLCDRIETLTAIVSELQERVANMVPSHRNKDGIPIGTEITADVEECGEVVLITEQSGYRVKKISGMDIVDGTKFKSLSAAAETMSGISRKSGWVFWKDRVTGRTLKDQYKG